MKPGSTNSFLKSLFAGDIDQEIVFPFPFFEEEEKEELEMILGALREFARDQIDPVQIDRDEAFPEHVMQGLREIGLFGLTVPQEYGGAGLSKSGFCRIFQEICRIDGSLGVMMGAHCGIGTYGLLMYGTEAQQRKYLPRMATGECIAAFALTEPGAGSDAAGIASKAVLNDRKSHFTLNGGKIWISNGGISGLWTVFAKTPIMENGVEKEKISAFLVEADWPGCSHGKPEHKFGIRGSNTTSLTFDNVTVPVENVLGPLGKGFKIAMEVLNVGRLSLAAGCVGGCHGLIAESLAYATHREQFGRPIASFEIIQDKLSRAAAEAYAAESMSYLTARLADRGTIDYAIESAICKIYASESLWRTVNESMQIAGGVGYSREYEYERYVRDARIQLIFEGTNEILRVFTALAGMQGPGEYLKSLGKALRDPIKGFGLLTVFAANKVRERVRPDSLKNIASELSGQARAFNEGVASLHQLVEKLLIKHGQKVIERQFQQERLAEMAILLFGMAAVISRVHTHFKAGRDMTRELGLAKLYCDIATRELKSKAKEVERNVDAQRRETAAALSEHGGTWFEILDG